MIFLISDKNIVKIVKNKVNLPCCQCTSLHGDIYVLHTDILEYSYSSMLNVHGSLAK